MKLNIISGAYKGRYLGIDGQECVNLYPEMSASGEAKNVAALIGTPGLELIKALGSTAGCRGLFTTARDRLLAVVGSELYELTKDLTIINRGTLATGTGSVSFAEIDKQPDPTSAAVSQVMIVDGSAGYIFNTQTNVLTKIMGDYLPGTSVISQNGFFLQTVNDSNKFIYSNYLDGLTWEASFNFFAAESSPDPILNITLLNNQVWLLNSKSIEIWNFTGNPALLWSRSNVGFLNTGVAGPHATATLNGTICWLGTDQGKSMIWMSGGSYNPSRISTHAIEYILSQIPDVTDAVCFAYQAEGHQFFVWNFPQGNRTIVYDVATSLWHERGSYNTQDGENDRHRAMYLTVWNSKIVVGDNANSNIYEWSLDYYTDAGRIIKRIRTCAHIHNERHRIFFHQLEIDMIKGYALQGPSTVYGSDPSVMLTWSNDGGYNYAPIELWGRSGKIGQRLNRVRYNKLGMSRDRVFRIIMTEPVPIALIDARLDASFEVP